MSLVKEICALLLILVAAGVMQQQCDLSSVLTPHKQLSPMAVSPLPYTHVKATSFLWLKLFLTMIFFLNDGLFHGFFVQVKNERRWDKQIHTLPTALLGRPKNKDVSHQTQQLSVSCTLTKNVCSYRQHFNHSTYALKVSLINGTDNPQMRA